MNQAYSKLITVKLTMNKRNGMILKQEISRSQFWYMFFGFLYPENTRFWEKFSFAHYQERKRKGMCCDKTKNRAAWLIWYMNCLICTQCVITHRHPVCQPEFIYLIRSQNTQFWTFIQSDWNTFFFNTQNIFKHNFRFDTEHNCHFHNEICNHVCFVCDFSDGIRVCTNQQSCFEWNQSLLWIWMVHYDIFDNTSNVLQYGTINEFINIKYNGKER